MAVGAIATYTAVDSNWHSGNNDRTDFPYFRRTCSLLWLWFGASLKRFLQKPIR